MLSPSNGAGFSANTAGAGTTNQNTAFNETQAALNQQQNFLTALAQQNGLGNQSSVFNQQQGLANQLQGVANGTGPNPAQAQLAQSTAANTANQAALMAGQRGSSQNPGLIARQAAMQGAQNQQQAVGQSATLQAQQQLAGMQQLQNQQASMGNLANTQVGQQQQGIGALNQYSLQGQGNLLGAQANQNSTNAQIAAGNQTGQQGMIGGLMGAAGAGMQMIADGGEVKKMASGGSTVASNPLMQPITDQQVAQVGTAGAGSGSSQGPQSNVGKMMTSGAGANSAMGQGMMTGASLAKGIGNVFGAGDLDLPGGSTAAGSGFDTGIPLSATDMSDFGAMAGGAGDTLGSIGTGIEAALPEIGEGIMDVAPEVAMAAAKGGQVPVMLSPGERKYTPQEAKEVAEGKKHPLSTGKVVPGKPKVKGAKDSYQNDTFRTSLAEGSVIAPRSTTKSDDPAEKIAAFVRDTLAKSGHIPKKKK